VLQKLTTMRISAPLGHEQPWDLREILNFLWREWKFIGTFAAVALVLAAIWLVKETPRYTAIAQVLLEPQGEKAGGRDAILTDQRLDTGEIESQMAIIRSSVFLRRVVEREHLIDDAEFGSSPPKPGSSSVGDLRAYISSSGDKSGAQPAKSQSSSAEMASSVEALKNALTVIRVGQGYILNVSVTSVDPVRAARLANATADAYIVDKLDARFEAAKRASGWLSDRLVDLRKQLRQSEEAVATFRAEHGIPVTTNITLNQQQLSDLNARLVAAKAEMAEKKARVDILESIEAKGGSVLSLPDTVANAGTLPSLQAQLAAISQREAELSSRYSNNHPLLVNVRAERRDVERAIKSEAERIAGSMRNEYVLAKAKVDALEKSLQQVTGQSGDDESAIKLRELERTAVVNKTLFEDFLQRAKITEEQSTFEPRDARVISAALPPGAPSYPLRGRTFLIALFLGLLVGTGGAYAKERLNSGFTTPRQVEEILELPLLASVSQLNERDLTVDGKVLSIPMHPIMRPLSRFSESMRALRNGIQMADVDHPPKVLQLTSTVPSEGKTTIGMSLASSVATSGLKVLFIDADLRHPSASRILGLYKEKGLVDLLLGQANTQDVVRYQESSKIWVLCAGSRTQNPADLLGSERLKTLMENFRKDFDFVILDTPPVGPVVDPVVVSNIVDKILYVVKWGATAREMVQHAIEQLPHSKKVAGIVFNNVDEQLAKKYGKYAYANYYGSRYYSKYYSG